ncbi:MAG: Hpt domain-containing protein, partial [Lachnospiraceae bacterium]|nr:Hpt domain-containing protein [Lachnospiraceae bacterium]
DDMDDTPVKTGGGDIQKKLEENGFNTKDGLGYSGGDIQFYRELLGDYASSAEERLGELEKAMSESDWNSYMIKVHALKSVAKSVGDTKVFEQALALEQASKAGKADTVRRDHAKMARDYEASSKLIEENM